MKKLLFALTAVLLCFSISVAKATTFRVNNNLATNGGQRIFNSLTAAHASTNVQAGDTLLVEGSGTDYAGFTCTKKLVIIGPGYFLTQNGQNQANALGASVQGIAFNAGSEGSAIIGLTFATGASNYVPSISVNDITIMRCYLSYGISIVSTITRMLVLQNYISQSGIYVNSSATAFSDVILKNNIIASAFSTPQQMPNPRLFSNVENNIFLGSVTLSANSFINNIIASPTATVSITATSTGNLFATAGQLPATGNTQVANPAALFVGLAGAANSTDGQYRLATSTAYPTTGATQPGIFGGTEPYRLSGIPAIPTIYSLRTDAVGSKQSGLNVTIGARVNP
ncbi:MAG: hypothetical protein ACRYFR_03310 [Janthinobacterium lividum]